MSDKSITREIKFRAWHAGRMWLVARLEWHKKGRLVYVDFQDGDHTRTTLAGGDAVEVMQFTGLLDKDGREIYEGDVVKHNGTNSDARRNPLMAISFLDGAFCLATDGVLFGCDPAVTIRDAMTEARCHRKILELEVVGNIYQNAELLERSQ